jgi:hypothetical protein
MRCTLSNFFVLFCFVLLVIFDHLEFFLCDDVDEKIEFQLRLRDKLYYYIFDFLCEYRIIVRVNFCVVLNLRLGWLCYKIKIKKVNGHFVK